jgi:hypothetical protein
MLILCVLIAVAAGGALNELSGINVENSSSYKVNLESYRKIRTYPAYLRCSQTRHSTAP